MGAFGARARRAPAGAAGPVLKDGTAARSSCLWRDELALKPEDGETFLREVDEELRRDQMNRFVKRYGWAIVGAFVLVMGAVGGWIWWQNHRQEAVAKEGETLT